MRALVLSRNLAVPGLLLVMAVPEAWAVPSSSSCSSGDSPTQATGTSNTTFCTWTSSQVPEPGWVCDTTAVCGSGSATAYMVYYNGDQWVAWVYCGVDDNSPDDCEVLPRTEVGGVPETEGMYLKGGPAEDVLSLTYGGSGPYDLHPVPGSGDTIRGYAYGLGDPDTIHGSPVATAYSEFLYGGDGGDRIYGKGGNDHLYGGNGADRLEGGPGNDTLEGGADSDTLLGGDDDDIIYGGGGADKIAGGRGNDKIDPGDGGDYVCGDEHTEVSGVMTACAAEDPTYDGDDQVRGSVGNDSIWTQDGQDKICDSDADVIDAGSDSDEVYHDGSYSSLSCGPGADTSNVSVTDCEPPPTLSACTVPNTW